MSSLHPKYPLVFSPIKLGPMAIPNRFYFGPHGNSLSFGNRPAQDFAHYGTAHAKGGGCGLVVNSLTVHDRGATFQPSPHPEENIASFRAMAEVVHAAGAKIFAELWYHWSSGGRWQPFGPLAPSMGASPALFEMNDVRWSAHEMDKSEIRSLVRAFGVSTAHLRQAGYDGVMLHAAHAAILEHFLSPYFNRRSDEYGGSLTKRMRFVVEALESAHEGAGG